MLEYFLIALAFLALVCVSALGEMLAWGACMLLVRRILPPPRMATFCFDGKVARAVCEHYAEQFIAAADLPPGRADEARRRLAVGFEQIIADYTRRYSHSRGA